MLAQKRMQNHDLELLRMLLKFSKLSTTVLGTLSKNQSGSLLLAFTDQPKPKTFKSKQGKKISVLELGVLAWEQRSQASASIGTRFVKEISRYFLSLTKK